MLNIFKNIKIYISILFLLTVNSYAKVTHKGLSEFYDGCLDNAKRSGLYSSGLKICGCAINIINTKLTNQEFEKIFNSEQELSDKWMKENIVPYCNFRT